MSLRSLATTTKTTKPMAPPPTEAMRNSSATCVASTPTEVAAMAVRRATRAVASLSSDSPSRIVTMRRGSPILRATAVAATASGGATTAPIANETGHEMPGMSACTMAPTPKVVNTTRPTESSRIGPSVGVEVDERGLDRRGVEQRWQQPEQHHLGLEMDLGDAGHVRRHHADRDQQQRRREVQAVGQGRERQHGHGEGDEQDGDLHAVIVSEHARTRFVCGLLWDFPLAAADESLDGVRRAGRPSASGRPSRAPRRRAWRRRARRGCGGAPRR